MIVLRIFTDYLSRAYEGWVLRLIGFFVLPTATLANAIAQEEMGGLRSWGLILVVFSALLDIGIWARGRGVFKRD